MKIMSTLKTLALATLVIAAGAAHANGPAGYDPLAFVQAEMAASPTAAPAAPAKAASASVVVVAKKLGWPKFIHPVVFGNGAAGYDPLAFVMNEVKKEEAPRMALPETAPLVAASSVKR